MKFVIRYILFVFLLFTFRESYTQNKQNIKRYISFLKRDSLQNNTYLTVSCNFMYSSIGKISQGGRGCYLSLGLNLARFFSKKIVLGVTFDLQPFSGLWNHKFKQNYINDFNQHYSTTSLGTIDSGRVQTVYNSLNNNINYDHFGNQHTSYGIMFSPYPTKYGGLMLILKRGQINYRVSNGGSLDSQETDNLFITVPIDYKFELVCKPFYLFRQNNKRKYLWLNYFQVSAFFQKVSWKDAKIDGLAFNRFMSPTFQNKYSCDYHFGFTFRIGIY